MSFYPPFAGGVLYNINGIYSPSNNTLGNIFSNNASVGSLVASSMSASNMFSSAMSTSNVVVSDTISTGTLVANSLNNSSINSTNAIITNISTGSISGGNIQLSSTISAATHVGTTFSAGTMHAATMTAANIGASSTVFASMFTGANAQISGTVSVNTVSSGSSWVGGTASINTVSSGSSWVSGTASINTVSSSNLWVSGNISAGTTYIRAVNPQMRVYNTTPGSETSIKFNGNDGTQDWYVGQNVGAVGVGNFAIYSANSGNSMSFLSTGNIGVGTNAPGYKLDIVGQTRMSAGALIPGSNAFEFGHGVAGKEANAGKIAYAAFTSGLDVVGAGTGSDRLVKIWDHLNVDKSISAANIQISGTVSTGTIVGTNIYIGNPSHGLGYNATGDGPQIFGYLGGSLAYKAVDGVTKNSLIWSSDGISTSNVKLTGSISAATLVGSTMTAANIGASTSISTGTFYANTIGTATVPVCKITVSGSGYGSRVTDNTISLDQWIGGGTALIGTYTNHPLGFYTNNGATRLIVSTSGNVGINTTSPGYTLDVSGDINFTGNLRQNGTVFSGSGSSQWTSTSGSSISYTSGSVVVGTLLSTSNLIATNISAGSITAANAQISGTVSAATHVGTTFSSGTMHAATMTAANIGASSTVFAATFTGANAQISGTVSAANIASNTVTTGSVRVTSIYGIDFANNFGNKQIGLANLASASFFGFGANNLAMQYQTGIGCAHRFYTGSTEGTSNAALGTLVASIDSNGISTGSLVATNISAGNISASNIYLSGSVVSVNVTTLNLIDNNITAASIVASNVTAGNISASNIVGKTAISAGSLVMGGILTLNDQILRIRSPSDIYHGMQYTFGNIDGPQLFGYGGGALGYMNNSNPGVVVNTLIWNSSGISTSNAQFSGTVSAGTFVGSTVSTGSVNTSTITAANIVGTSNISAGTFVGSTLSTGSVNTSTITAANIVGTSNISAGTFVGSTVSTGSSWVGGTASINTVSSGSSWVSGTASINTVSTGSSWVSGTASINTVSSGSSWVSGTASAATITSGRVQTASITSNSLYINTTNDVPAINPDAFNSLIVYEDMTGTSLRSGTLSGSATFDATNDWIQLTPALNSQDGTYYWNINPGNAFTATYEHLAGGGTGADQTTFYWNTNGYNIRFDEYAGSPNRGIGIYFNGTSLTRLDDTTWADNNWHKIQIVFFRNQFRIYVDNSLKINYIDTTVRTLSGDNMGFNASTGGANNNHRIRNIRISKFTEGLWSYVNQTSGNIMFNGGNVGVNTIAPGYTLDVSGTAAATTFTGGNMQLSSTISAATYVGTTFSAGTIHAATMTAANIGGSAGVSAGTLSATNAVVSSGITTGRVISANISAGSITVGNLYNNGSMLLGRTTTTVNFTQGCLGISTAEGNGRAIICIGNDATTSTNNWHIVNESNGVLTYYNGNYGGGTNRMSINNSGDLYLPGTINMGTTVRYQSLALYNDGTNYFGFGVNDWGIHYNAGQSGADSSHYFYTGSVVGNRGTLRATININGMSSSNLQLSSTLSAATVTAANIGSGNMSAGSLIMGGHVNLPVSKYIAFAPSDTFTTNGNTIGHYSLGWYSDPATTAFGNVAYLTGYGGIRFATNGLFRMSILNSGNVGIGTTAPGYTLDVSGDINFTGNLRQNGTIFSGSGSSQWTSTSGSSISYTSGSVVVGTLLSTSNLIATNISAGSLSGANAQISGTISAGTIVGTTFSAGTMHAATMTAANIGASSTVFAATFTGANAQISGTVSAANIASNTVTTGSVRVTSIYGIDFANNFGNKQIGLANIASSSFFGFGANNSAMQYQTGIGSAHRFYTGSTEGTSNAALGTLVASIDSNGISTGSLVATNISAGNISASNIYISGSVVSVNVTTLNLIDNNITSANIVASNVTAGNISAASLNMSGTLSLNNQSLFLRDMYHQLIYNATLDGPQLYGYGGGALGYRTPGTVTPVNILSWNSNGISTGNATFTGSITSSNTIRITNNVYGINYGTNFGNKQFALAIPDATSYYGIGADNSAMQYQTGIGATHKFFISSTQGTSNAALGTLVVTIDSNGISTGTLAATSVTCGGTISGVTFTGANAQLSGTISAGTHVGTTFSAGTMHAGNISASSARMTYASAGSLVLGGEIALQDNVLNFGNYGQRFIGISYNSGVDGPVIYGWSGGDLSYTSSGVTVSSLRWNSGGISSSNAQIGTVTTGTLELVQSTLSSKTASISINASATNITGFSFSSSTTASFTANVTMICTSAIEYFTVHGVYSRATSTWMLDSSSIGDSTGLTLSITSTGQMQYTATVAGTLRWTYFDNHIA